MYSLMFFMCDEIIVLCMINFNNVFVLWCYWSIDELASWDFVTRKSNLYNQRVYLNFAAKRLQPRGSLLGRNSGAYQPYPN